MKYIVFLHLVYNTKNNENINGFIFIGIFIY